MRDPVLLPSSKAIVDRSTIKQHYLSDATDPFNRQPLAWEDIQDAVEVREQIAEWLRERRKKKEEQRAEAAAAAATATAALGESPDDAMKIDEA